MPKITVIMPSYNVAPYIAECMDSVIHQTLEDIEILAIDAGSTDGTLDILEEYALGDQRIKLIHSDVKSYGYQLNLGISLAKGEYIGVVETDDYVDRDMYRLLYDTAGKTGVDFIKCSHYEFLTLTSGERWFHKVEIFPSNAEKYGKIISPEDCQELYGIDVYLWRGIYRKAFLERCCISFHETEGAAYQDAGFVFQAFSLASYVIYIQDPLYYYRKDNEKSSVYNERGMDYLVREYGFIKETLWHRDNLPGKFRKYYFSRMFDQVITRVFTAAAYGRPYERMAEPLEKMSRLLAEGLRNGYIDRELWKGQRSLQLHMLTKVSEKYMTYQQCLYETKWLMLEDMFQKAKLGTILIFGSGVRGGFIRCLLDKHKIGKQIFFCDNDREKHGKTFLGELVISPEQAMEAYQDAIYLLYESGYTEEMYRQLLDGGVRKECIFVYEFGMDFLLL